MNMDPLNQRPKEPFVTAAEVARFLGCHPSTVRNMARDGRLPYYQVPPPKGVRFLLSEVRAWTEENKREVLKFPGSR